ncbi:rhomboid family intramembrane serine protease [Microbacterium esteraromaticum]|uniref:rhomboid family intramembrane serine protease n=1 Tax=Microbacterium esteraromaticum TaxID=57043 RepID=UPI002367DCE6|nr:rhomboid family intramembrane serine protease [Microbacterium esteraromaticum]WDH78880.1 rhomboid family intramembrane serine protease [Microbacterium esteraromaticum]
MTSPDLTQNRENFCYRHPDRQSFVLCQRCMRTICPECQTQAPVGVICPECMKAERKARTPAQRRAQRRWGGSIAADGRPLVTYAIIAVTAAVSLLQMVPVIGGYIQRALIFAPAFLYPDLSGAPFEPWRMLTAMLLHGGFIHLGLNMLALWMLGRSLEPMLGRWRFLSLYLISGFGGSVAVACLAPNTLTVGASGGVFGLMAALLIIGRHIGANVTGILVVLGINFAFGLFVERISWQAHLGGALVGAAVAYIFTRTRQRKQRTAQIWLLVALVVVLIGLTAFVPPALIAAGVFG